MINHLIYRILGATVVRFQSYLHFFSSQDFDFDPSCDGKLKTSTKKDYVETEELVNPIELTYTKKGNATLIMNGYMYTMQHRGAIKIAWRCTNFRHHKCGATAATYSDYELSMVGCERGLHNHLPDPRMVEKSRMMKVIKEKYYELQNSNQGDEKLRRKELYKYVKDVMYSLPEELKSSMPSISGVIRNLQRLRQKEMKAAPKERVSMEGVQSKPTLY